MKPKRDPNRPKITPELLDRFRRYNRLNPAWGSLHIVLDDHNTEDSSVDFCVAWATEHNDLEGMKLGEILRQLTKTQRERIATEGRWPGLYS